MSTPKKDNRVANFRLSVIDDDTHRKIWSAKFSRTGIAVSLITAAVVLSALMFSLIAFTPIRTFIPGYPDARTKHAAIENAIRIDSLENVVLRWELYSENLRRVVDGQPPLKIDSILNLRKRTEEAAPDAREIARNDSLLRKQVDSESQFEINANTKRSLPIEGLHFFTPLHGIISQDYDKALHPYVDITAPENSVVMSVLDGTVISAGWSDENGYTIQIQHEGNIVSVYKHNQKLMKKSGDKVTAGMPIAIVGNAGTLSTGNHLHFELWHNGEAVDPAKYISF